MAQQKANFLHAAGRFSGATPPVILVAGSGNWSVARNAQGLFDVTLNDPIDPLERNVQVTLKTTSLTAAVVTASDTDTVFRVSIEDDASAAQDSDVDFVVFRVAG